MSLDRDISLLSRIPLFSELTTEQLRLLAFSAVRLELSPGQILFRENAAALSGYIIAYGGIELTVGEGQQGRALVDRRFHGDVVSPQLLDEV